MEYKYSIDFSTGEYICAKCGKRIKIAPRNHARTDKGYCDYWGNGQRYNYRGGKGALVNHLKACYKKNP